MSPMLSGDVHVQLRRLERLVAGLPSECGSLWDDLQAVKRHIAQREPALLALGREARALREELLRAGDALSGERQQRAEVARQLVAIQRLHSTLDRTQMLQALAEIVASLVGCEEMAVFELAGASALLVPIHAVGLAAGALAAVRLGEDTLGRAIAAGKIFVADDKGGGDRSVPRLTACAPLRVDGRLVGALTLFRLLEHKAKLEASDISLLEQLGVHAGVALAATGCVKDTGRA